MKAQRDGNTGKWLIQYRYTDWQGNRKKSTKRGFETKREAEEWLRNFLVTQQVDFDMNFEDFLKIYYEDMAVRLRENTMRTKKYIIDLKILPYFGKRSINSIISADIRKWQNELMQKGYSQTYLKTVNNQLNAVFNYAVKYYDLKGNPVLKAGSVGKKEATEMLFWTKDEYLKFTDSMMDKPLSFYAFEVLYWCGVRMGEMLALTPADFDFDKNTVSITKSYQRLSGKDVITDPKTPKSKRIIQIPEFLSEEIQEYIKSLYGCAPTDRLFPISKSYLHHEMTRGAKEQGIKRIRIHDIRHSRVSLLIEMGFSAVAIADRVGHESIDITYRYAHLFPSKQMEMAQKLNIERGGF